MESKWIFDSFVTPSTMVRDLGAELPLDVGERRAGVLDGVVQQGGDHRDVVHTDVHDDACAPDRVDDVRLAGVADLAAVVLLGEEHRSR